jgi:hypothetical protein
MVVPPPWDPDKLKRQERYIDALRALPNVDIYLGHYMPKTRKCPLCRREYGDFEEKSTDVCIATQMLSDAYGDNCDDIILVSGDGDLKDPLSLIHHKFSPTKRITIVFPPMRDCVEFKRLEKRGTCNCLYVTQTELGTCQFPDTVYGIHNYPLTRPSSWK